MRNWWRKLWRNPLIVDLRFIRPRYRHLYRRDFEKGSLGYTLRALREAYDAGHFYPEHYLTPKEKAKLQD